MSKTINKLGAELAKLEAQEHDKRLSDILKAFKGTEAHQALELFLSEDIEKNTSIVTNPRTPDSTRTFYAGRLEFSRGLLAWLEAAFVFDPAEADYSEPDFSDTDLNQSLPTTEPAI